MSDFFYKASGTLTPELDMKIVLKLETWLKKSFPKKILSRVNVFLLVFLIGINFF